MSPSTSGDERFREHRNAFGFLRLAFAALVIAAHVPEVVDGDNRRELLYRLFGTTDFGKFAVDGFFLISGYLITKSFEQSPRALPFLKKRVARIYPAFAVASLISILVFAPLGGASWATIVQLAPALARKIVSLQPPNISGVFGGTHHNTLNESMWTIFHEARCYLLVLVLGAIGALKRPWIIALLAVGSLAAFELAPAFLHDHFDGLPFAATWIGDAGKSLRLIGLFMAGACFYLWRSRIRFTAWGAVVAAVGVVTCLFFPLFAEPGLATFGAYLLFMFARWGSGGLLGNINNRNDISYGLYLYAWPIQKLIGWTWPAIPMVVLGLITLAIAALCGCASWFLLEKPVMERLRGKRSILTRSQQGDLNLP